MKNQIKDTFIKIFGDKENLKIFFSPGRVNLIGEHTDYNGGNVFPCALSFGTYGAISLRDDKKVRMYSSNFEDIGVIEFDLDSIKYEKAHDWVNYPKGVIDVMKKNGYNIDKGFDVAICGNIPNGAGLSSSASLELLIAVMMDKLFNFNIDRVDLVKFSQKAENAFVGVNCGIMDQFAIGMGKKDSAILLDCNTLKYSYSKVDLKDEVLVISNTNKRRGLADSKYNERRKECDDSLDTLKKYTNISSLCELTSLEFETYKDKIEDSNKLRRCVHAISENERVKDAVKALKENNLELFGQLMNQSHISLRDDYEVTGKELDTLAENAWKQPGVLGARMTGAGFGGCAIAIVNNAHVDEFIKNVGQAYKDAIGYEASFYVASIGNGPTEL